jgi:hypothetical protein
VTPDAERSATPAAATPALPPGRAAIGFPKTLTVQQGDVVFVRIAALDQIGSAAGGESGGAGILIVDTAAFEQVEQTIPLYPYMQARLIGDPADLAITYSGPGASGGEPIWRKVTGAGSESGAVTWLWQVRALRAGELRVTVVISGKRQFNDAPESFEDVLTVPYALDAVEAARVVAPPPPALAAAAGLASPAMAGLALAIAVAAAFVRRRETNNRYAEVAPGLGAGRTRLIHRALVSAFTTRGLVEFAALEMGVNLEEVSDVRNLRSAALDLIGWAQAQGQTASLVEKVIAFAPGNPAVKQLAAEFKAGGGV